MSGIVSLRDVGDTIKSAVASAFTSVTAGGAGNAVAVVGSAVDRLDAKTGSLADSCQFSILYSGTLAATKTISLTGVKIEQSADGVTWDATPYAVLTDPGVVATGAGSVSGVASFNQNLRSAKRFVRFDWTPTLSNTATDTSSVVGAVVLGGYDRLPS
jgi:hypothetical protein